MFNFTKILLYAILYLVVFFPGFISAAPGVDQTDPEAVARHILTAMQGNNPDAIFEIMEKDRQKHFSPYTPENRQVLEAAVKKDLEKIGANAKVAELRKCATLSGKPGIAVKVAASEDEVHVLILSQEGTNYYYVNLQSLSTRYYDTLALIKKVE
jgi:hypothetical protein